jgi:hypothetical protein
VHRWRNPQLKHTYDEKLSLDGSELITAMEALPPSKRNYSGKSLHGGSALTVEIYTIRPTSYDDYNDHDGYDAFSEHNCYGQSKSTYPTVFTQFMNSRLDRYTERGSAFELLSIAALPASPWYPDCFGDLGCHQNRHTSRLAVLVTRSQCQRKIIGERKSHVCLFVYLF